MEIGGGPEGSEKRRSALAFTIRTDGKGASDDQNPQGGAQVERASSQRKSASKLALEADRRVSEFGR